MITRNRTKKDNIVQNTNKEETEDNVVRKLVNNPNTLETETGKNHGPMKSEKFKKEKITVKNLSVPEMEADDDHEAGKK